MEIKKILLLSLCFVGLHEPLYAGYTGWFAKLFGRRVNNVAAPQSARPVSVPLQAFQPLNDGGQPGPIEQDLGWWKRFTCYLGSWMWITKHKLQESEKLRKDHINRRFDSLENNAVPRVVHLSKDIDAVNQQASHLHTNMDALEETLNNCVVKRRSMLTQLDAVVEANAAELGKFAVAEEKARQAKLDSFKRSMRDEVLSFELAINELRHGSEEARSRFLSDHQEMTAKLNEGNLLWQECLKQLQSDNQHVAALTKSIEEAFEHLDRAERAIKELELAKTDIDEKLATAESYRSGLRNVREQNEKKRLERNVGNRGEKKHGGNNIPHVELRLWLSGHNRSMRTAHE
jgi:chromosome segregation ATPase